MNISQITIAGLVAGSLLLTSCKNEAPVKEKTAAETAKDRQNEDARKKREELNKEYFKVPDENLLDNGASTPLVLELKQRYKSDLKKLKEQVESSGAKFVLVILSPESGKEVASVRYGVPFIREVSNELGIELVDFTPLMAKKTAKEITQWPRDGHWSKAGTVYIADVLEPIIKKYYSNTSSVTYKDSERSETFGDFAPSSDEILDGGKDMPYHVKANAQGVRMDQDITFPKKKKHILLIGDSGFFCPFLNNEFTIAGVLQQRFPDALFMNTATIGYTMEDHVTLWNEKAKYAEPDIVLVQTNGGDIIDYFFTHRNILSRSHKPFYPTPNEEEWYRKTYPNAVQ